MDPLSISASVAGLIMITNSIVTNGFKYLSEFKQSDETIRNLFHEVNLLFGILHSLEKVTERLEADESSHQYTTRIHHINACDNTLRKIAAQLDKVKAKRNKTIDKTRQRLLWTMSKLETQNLLAEVERHKASLSLALSVDEMSALLSALATQNIIQNGISKIGEDLRSYRIMMDETALSKKRQDIIMSLNAANYNEYQSSNVRLRQAGTGGWFLDGDEYRHWLSTKNGKLWLYGIPGAGKTVLMSTIIQDAQRLISEQAGYLGMAFFFCDYKKSETHSVSTILGSLIKQLALQNDRSLHDLETFYATHGSNEKDPPKFTSLELYDLLKTMASHFKDAMIIIDGLDEIEMERAETMEILRDLTSSEKIKTLFASRDEVDIRRCLAEYVGVSIAAQSGDLRLYVAAEIETRTARHQLSLRDPDLKEHIMKTLITGAHGMFRWVACQMDYLCELNNDEDRRDALQQLPPDLPATYERILNRVKIKANQELVKRTLQWLVCARRPVTPELLLAVLSIKNGDRALKETAMTTMVDVMRWCSSLIRWKDRDSKHIELAHFTVKEFLLKIDPAKQPSVADYEIDIEGAECYLARTCLTIINFEEFAVKPPPRQGDSSSWTGSRDIEDAFRYASEYWPIHAYEHLNDERVTTLYRELFEPVKSNNFLWWTKYLVAGALEIVPNKVPDYFDLTTLHLAACLGLRDTTEWLLEQSSDVNRASQFGTPLILALCSIDGLAPTARRKPSQRRLRLGLAPLTKHWNQESRIETIGILLKGGANANQSQTISRATRKAASPLEIGLFLYFPEIVQMLLEHGARITKAVIKDVLECHEKGGDYEVEREVTLALLQGANDDNVDQDAKEVLAQLRELFMMGRPKEEDFDSPLAEEYSGPLSDDVKRERASELRTAASNGQLSRVKRSLHILQNSAGDDGHISAVQMALHLAARYHHFAVVQFLLQNNASTQHQDDSGNSPLHHACMIEPAENSDALKIVDLLLQHRADPTMLNKEGLSPLHTASRFKNPDSVQELVLLMNAAPDLSSILEQGNQKQSPVWCAIEDGSDAAVTVLLEKCSIEIIQGLSWNKLSCLVPAIQRESTVVLEMLLEKGVDCNSPVGDGSHAIHHASEPEGSFGAVTALLRKVADCSIKRPDGLTPLHIIAQSPSSDAINKLEALVFAGADINCVTLQGRSVLQVAVGGQEDQHTTLRDAKQHRLRLVKSILQQENTDFNYKDADGQTALMISLSHDFCEASEVLVSHGCDITAKSSDGCTALHYICKQRPSKQGNALLLKLIESGLQLTEKDDKGKTAFEFALESAPGVQRLASMKKPIAVPKAEEKKFANVTLRVRSSKDQESSSGDIWAPFASASAKDDSDSESESDYDDYQYDQNTRDEYDSPSISEYWRWPQLWDERMSVCTNHMSSDQLSRRMTTGRHPLSFLIEHAASSTIKLMLEKGVDVDAVDTNVPAVAMDIAASHGCNSEIAASLIAKTRRPIDAFTAGQSRNPLQNCCLQGQSTMVLLRQLLAAGADATIPDREGKTPLIIAAGAGAVASLRTLLKHGVSVNAQQLGKGDTALHMAIEGGSAECVLALLRAGSQVDIKNSSQLTPLHLSGVHQRWDLAEILIRHAAPAATLEMSGGTSIIHTAAKAGAEHILRLVLELPSHLDINTQDKDYYTPLQLATTYGDISCFKLLLAHGASIDASSGNGGLGHMAVYPISNDIRKALLDRNITWDGPSPVNININGTDMMNILPLHRAACLGNSTCIKFLHDHDLIGDIDAPASFNMTALHFAACFDHSDTINLLLSLGANKEALESRHLWSPLLYAARVHSAKSVRVLLDHGCSVQAVDSEGCTAHMLAVQYSYRGGPCAEITKHLKNHKPVFDSNLGAGLPATGSEDATLSTFGPRPSSTISLRIPMKYGALFRRFMQGEILLIAYDKLKGQPGILDALAAHDGPGLDFFDEVASEKTQHLLTDVGVAPGEKVEQAKIGKIETEVGSAIEKSLGRRIRTVLSHQNSLVAAMMIGIAMLLVWVVIKLEGLNRALRDMRN